MVISDAGHDRTRPPSTSGRGYGFRLGKAMSDPGEMIERLLTLPRWGCRRHSAKAETHTAAHRHRMRITVAVSLACDIRMMAGAHGVSDVTGSRHGPMVQGHAGYDRDKNC